MDLEEINQKINQEIELEAEKETYRSINKESSLVIARLIKVIRQTIWSKVGASLFMPFYIFIFFRENESLGFLLSVFISLLFITIIDIQRLKKFQSEILKTDYTTPKVLFQTIVNVHKLYQYLSSSYLAVLVLLPVLLLVGLYPDSPENVLQYFNLDWVKENINTVVFTILFTFLVMFLMGVALYANQQWLGSIFKKAIQNLEMSYEKLLSYKTEDF